MTRAFLSDRAARAVAQVVADAGIPVLLANDYVPTPAVSYNVKKLGAAGGVMVTSSHNPWNWNGVKFKAKFGGSATPAIMKSIEDELGSGAMPDDNPTHSQKTRMSWAPAKIKEVDLKPAYVEAISQFADLDLIRRANFKFAIDSMYGSGRGVLPKIFDAHGIRYVAIRQEVNPLFPGINPEPILPHVALSAGNCSEGKMPCRPGYRRRCRPHRRRRRRWQLRRFAQVHVRSAALVAGAQEVARRCGARLQHQLA